MSPPVWLQLQQKCAGDHAAVVIMHNQAQQQLQKQQQQLQAAEEQLTAERQQLAAAHGRALRIALRGFHVGAT
jgi:hypothetical protein